MPIRLTDERLDHILDHPEIVGMESVIVETLRDPENVIQSRSDDEVKLYHRFYTGTPVGEKFLCIVVKVW